VSHLFLIALARGHPGPPATVARLHDGLIRATLARETLIGCAEGLDPEPPAFRALERRSRAELTSLCTSHGLPEPVLSRKLGQTVKIKLGRNWLYVPCH